MNKTQFFKLLVSILLPLGLGAMAGMFTSQSIPEWYATLNRPSFSPPNWLFGPVWTILYILMGISLFLIWKQNKTKERNRAILIFMIQMLLNFGWTFIFFYFNRIGIALFEIIVLWLSIVAMIIQFYKIKPLATYLNVPYLLWVSFASILNTCYYMLN